MIKDTKNFEDFFRLFSLKVYIESRLRLFLPISYHFLICLFLEYLYGTDE